jgi:hypothetical protein
MAFVSNDLSVLSYANGFTLWHYTTPHSAAVVNGDGYFNGASDMLRTGDMILVNSGEHPNRSAGMLVVTGNLHGAVTMAPLLATPATAEV